MSERPPNVLLVLQDQLRYDVVHDAALCRTPSLDRLRAEGTSFSAAYTPVGICGAARASLLTGLYAHTHGLLNNVHGSDAIARNLRHDLPTFGELAAKAGYRTGYVGKWHVGVGDQAGARGFADVALTDREIIDDYPERLRVTGVDDPHSVHTRYAPPAFRPADRFPRRPFPLYTPQPVEERLIPARGVLDESLALLERYAADDEPFVMVTSFIEPHFPSLLPEGFGTMYDPAALEPWPSFADTFEGKPRTNEACLRHGGVTDFTWDDWAPIVAHYLGAVSYIDHLVGQLLDALDAHGLAERTVVFASADHGDMTGSHRQFNKGPLMYEEVYRIPFIFRGPGVRAGAETPALASHVDILPTIVELTGAPAPETTHGRSLVPVLRGDADGWRDALLCEFHGDEFGLYSQRMLRTGDYKLVYNPNDLSELYDLAADPHELHNLAYDADLLPLRLWLETRLLELMYETDDSLRTLAVNTLG